MFSLVFCLCSVVSGVAKYVSVHPIIQMSMMAGSMGIVMSFLQRGNPRICVGVVME